MTRPVVPNMMILSSLLALESASDEKISRELGVPIGFIYDADLAKMTELMQVASKRRAYREEQAALRATNSDSDERPDLIARFLYVGQPCQVWLPSTDSPAAGIILRSYGSGAGFVSSSVHVFGGAPVMVGEYGGVLRALDRSTDPTFLCWDGMWRKGSRPERYWLPAGTP